MAARLACSHGIGGALGTGLVRVLGMFSAVRVELARSRSKRRPPGRNPPVPAIEGPSACLGSEPGPCIQLRVRENPPQFACGTDATPGPWRACRGAMWVSASRARGAAVELSMHQHPWVRRPDLPCGPAGSSPSRRAQAPSLPRFALPQLIALGGPPGDGVVRTDGGEAARAGHQAGKPGADPAERRPFQATSTGFEAATGGCHRPGMPRPGPGAGFHLHLHYRPLSRGRSSARASTGRQCTNHHPSGPEAGSNTACSNGAPLRPPPDQTPVGSGRGGGSVISPPAPTSSRPRPRAPLRMHGPVSRHWRLIRAADPPRRSHRPEPQVRAQPAGPPDRSSPPRPPRSQRHAVQGQLQSANSELAPPVLVHQARGDRVAAPEAVVEAEQRQLAGSGQGRGVSAIQTTRCSGSRSAGKAPPPPPGARPFGRMPSRSQSQTA